MRTASDVNRKPSIFFCISRQKTYNFAVTTPHKHITTVLLDNEKHILQLISEDDGNAFRELFDWYYPKVKVFLSTIISTEEDVDDLAQNVFVKIWSMRKILPEIRSFGGYLYRTCRNIAIDRCRKSNICIPLSEGYDEIESGDMADDEFMAKETDRQIESLLAKMPPKRRQVFIMSRKQGLSNSEIAERLNISKKTVENHLHTVLKDLRKIYSCISIFFT